MDVRIIADETKYNRNAAGSAHLPGTPVPENHFQNTGKNNADNLYQHFTLITSWSKQQTALPMPPVAVADQQGDPVTIRSSCMAVRDWARHT